MVTGEPIPVEKHAGDRVIGAINTTGALRFKPKKSAPTRCWLASSRWLRKRSGAGPPSRSSRTSYLRISCRL